VSVVSDMLGSMGVLVAYQGLGSGWGFEGGLEVGCLDGRW